MEKDNTSIPTNTSSTDSGITPTPITSGNNTTTVVSTEQTNYDNANDNLQTNLTNSDDIVNNDNVGLQPTSTANDSQPSSSHTNRPTSSVTDSGTQPISNSGSNPDSEKTSCTVVPNTQSTSQGLRTTHTTKSRHGRSSTTSKYSKHSSIVTHRKRLEIELKFLERQQQMDLQKLELEKAITLAKFDEEQEQLTITDIDNSERSSICNSTSTNSNTTNWIKSGGQSIHHDSSNNKLKSKQVSGNNDIPCKKLVPIEKLHKDEDKIDTIQNVNNVDYNVKDNLNMVYNGVYNQVYNKELHDIRNQNVNPFVPKSQKVVHYDEVDKNMDSLKTFIARNSNNNNLPQFNGHPSQWQRFITEFRTSTVNCNFSKTENQSRLRKCLIGKALEAVSSLLDLPECVDKILETLEQRFGRPEFIIRLLYQNIKECPVVKDDKLDTLIHFRDVLEKMVTTLQFMNEKDHLRNPILFDDACNKISVNSRIAFLMHYDKIKTDDSIKLVEFGKWISKKVNFACQLIEPSIPLEKANDKSKGATRKDQTCNVNTKSTSSKRQCPLCKKSAHSLTECDEFKKLEPDAKWDVVVKNRICFSCLKLDHNLKNCRQRKSCGIDGCEKPHNKLLHKPNETTKGKNNDSSATSKANDNLEQNFNVNNSTNTTLLKVIPVKLKGPNMTIETFALLDDASTTTLIDEEVANDLGLQGPKTHLQLEWMNKMTTDETDSRIVSLSISGIFENAKSFTLRHVKTKKDLCLPTYSVNREDIAKHFKHLPNVSFNNGKPVILIGQNNWHLLTTQKVIYGPWNGPALSKTTLGWVVHGNLSDDNSNVDQTFHVFCQNNQQPDKDDVDLLHDLVKDYFKLESVPTNYTENSCLSKEDKRCNEILEQTVRRVDNTHFECGLLWKRDDIVLPESKTAALKRLYTLEKKMDANEEFAKSYTKQFNDYVNKGYIKKLTDTEDKRPSKLWYLPHFGITNVNKPGKLRIVFDAASKSHGKSLNDFLLSGPDLYNSLQNILINFRIQPIAFVADIKEMFLQVQIRATDRPAQRLLWRGMDRQKEPDIYELQVVFFGSTSGPCLAQEIKNRNAKEFMNEYPDACHEIIDNHYMDDYLGGAPDVDTAKKLIDDIIKVHKNANFTLCNWISNSKPVIESIDETLRAKEKTSYSFDDNNQISERILGIWWDWRQDSFKFPLKMNKIGPDILNLETRPTKRDVLKVLMSIFDPLGLLTYFVIGGKILLQKIWESNIMWDDQITDSQYELWKNWIKHFEDVKSLQIPRRYTELTIAECDVELHIFCDASQEAYAAVAYLRFVHNQNVDCSLVNAKSRVAPLRPVSIPRLELQAALLGARLGNSLKTSLNIPIKKIFYWSDSENVLRWLKSSAKRYKVFVGQRIGEIQELSNVSDWYYVPTKLNIADTGTKIKSPDTDTWFNGPKFLLEPESNWPSQQKFAVNLKECSTELKTEYVNIISNSIPNMPIPNMAKLGSYIRLLRSTAWMMKFIDRYIKRTDDMRLSHELWPDEISKAEKYICRKIQKENFSAEYNLLLKGRPIPKSSCISKLNVFIDDEKIMRINTRLDNAELPFESKKPILLDSQHPITQLLIQHYHKENNHMGTDSIVCDIRTKFWIPQLKNTVKKIARNCQHCLNNRAKPQVPVAGQLPSCRVDASSRPFKKSGVDYFGPLMVTNGRKQEKRYGVIFTCMNIRAVHIEIANDLSSNAFIHVFRQFGTRRGFPDDLYSDNGTNFRKAEKEIAEAIAQWPNNDLTTLMTMKGCRWHFNPPAAPHMGGAWERLIRSIKDHLKEMLHEKSPPEYSLRTLFCEIESMLNSRPLTNVPLDADDAKPLTPNDFLIGPDNLNLQFVKTDDKDVIVLKKWQATQRLLDHLWKRFAKEYLTYIMVQPRGPNHIDSLAVGDVVLLVDPNLPRNIWPKGIIIKIYPGDDGQVRVAEVKTVLGVYKRPATKIVKLFVHKE